MREALPKLRAAQQKLTDTLEAVSHLLRLPELLQPSHEVLPARSSASNTDTNGSHSSSSSSSSTAARLQPLTDLPQLQLHTSRLHADCKALCSNLTDASRACDISRNKLQQLQSQHNPHTSGVQQLHKQLKQQQQELSQRQQLCAELQHQVCVAAASSIAASSHVPQPRLKALARMF